MHITALQTQVNNQERINIFVDDRFLLGASALVVLQMGLQEGQELTAEQLEQLLQEEAVQQATNRVMNFLSYRPRSREEVRLYLRKKDTPAELIEIVIQRLEELNLINDQAFAQFWIESRERSNPKSARQMERELRSKGVHRETVEELLTDEQDEERALQAARRKATQLASHPDMDFNTFRNRLGSFLRYRGFDYETTTRVVQTLWDETTNERD